MSAEPLLSRALSHPPGGRPTVEPALRRSQTRPPKQPLASQGTVSTFQIFRMNTAAVGKFAAAKDRAQASERAKARARRASLPRETRSFVGKMLSPTSQCPQAVVYRHVVVVLIVVNVFAFLGSTNKKLDTEYKDTFDAIEAWTSWLFLIDYILRIITCTERRKFRVHGPLCGRIRWMTTFVGLLDAVACLPYFLDVYLLHDVLPSTTWLRVFRLLVIVRTNRYAHAMNTCLRVLKVNHEILGVSVFLVFFMLLVTSAMLWIVSDKEVEEANSIYDVPSAMFMALLMLTGQGTPDGVDSLSQRLVVMMTAFLSVPFFAVPAAMLTWGFEGEAQRLAKRMQHTKMRQKIYGEKCKDMADLSSSDSDLEDDSDFDDYLAEVGGEDYDDDEAREGEALEFLKQLDLDNAPEPGNPGSLVHQAWEKGQELEKAKHSQQKNKTIGRDALLLLEQVREKNVPVCAPEDLEHLDQKVRVLAEQARSAVEEPSDEDAQAEIMRRLALQDSKIDAIMEAVRQLHGVQMGFLSKQLDLPPSTLRETSDRLKKLSEAS